ncbi:hypothetical protein P3T76_005745 [Phytophthora citrophthora]|uniref:Uncharacterized protein n=1 Tax=Phytophthora citrophthora TaxID=4793 RepID=A0AAD9GRV9_9STRA|nr:hypothetical protein P3T76_005745 [Phytophthora citrophthora]
MPVANQAPAAYEGIYLGKYGFTTVRARDRFTEFENDVRDRNFPSQHDMVLVFEMAIIGIPGYMLRRMEQALRNYLERRGVRARWHALGNGNARPFAEQFELVLADQTGNSLAAMYQRFIDAFEDRRQAAREEVTAADLLRDQQIRERRMPLRLNHRRESHCVRVMLVRRGKDPREETRRLRGDHEAAMALVEVQTPPVHVHAILERQRDTGGNTTLGRWEHRSRNCGSIYF